MLALFASDGNSDEGAGTSTRPGRRLILVRTVQTSLNRWTHRYLPIPTEMDGRGKSLATGPTGQAGRHERITKARSWAYYAPQDQLAQLRGAVFVHRTDSSSSALAEKPGLVSR